MGAGAGFGGWVSIKGCGPCGTGAGSYLICSSIGLVNSRSPARQASASDGAPYNRPVPVASSFPSIRPLWARLAAWLGFLAVFSALLSPVTMLTEEMRTGKLGGLCSVASSISSAGSTGDMGSDSGDASLVAGHCDLCGVQGLCLPPLRQAELLPPAAATMAAVFHDAVRSASSPGLPFSRGPPAI